jgi:hypothetical protein
LNCKACNREAGESGFYPLHLKAYKNIVRKYAVCRKGLKISWKEYLSRIEKNSSTGECAKEVAENLISNEEVKKWQKKLKNKPHRYLFRLADGSAKFQQRNLQPS